MRRTATYLLTTLAIALTLVLTGCKSTTKKETSSILFGTAIALGGWPTSHWTG